MPNYGAIIDGMLITSSLYKDGYKPLVYKDVPSYDENTQYVVEKQPVEYEDRIYIDLEVRELELDGDIDDFDDQELVGID